MEDAHNNGYKIEWPIYHFEKNRELNTREGYISSKQNVLEHYYGVELTRE